VDSTGQQGKEEKILRGNRRESGSGKGALNTETDLFVGGGIKSFVSSRGGGKGNRGP